LQKCLDALSRTEEALVQMKRKNAGQGVRAKLTQDQPQIANFGQTLITEVD
jgi:hypothetical protein